MATVTLADHALARRNRRVGLYALLGALAMLGLGYASVPLYRLFCQVTGFGGTTQRVDEAQAATVTATSTVMSIRFDANVERGLEWDFRPEQVTDRVSVGTRDMTVFIARNRSDQPITGTATFNVMPEQAGKYFSKIQCFCFTEQTLLPGQEVRMPVIYYVDPKMLDDPAAQGVENITLSYTFHRVAGSAAKALDRS